MTSTEPGCPVSLYGWYQVNSQAIQIAGARAQDAAGAAHGGGSRGWREGIRRHRAAGYDGDVTG